MKVTKHQYISKMIAYTEEGLSIIENKVKDIWIDEEDGPVQ